MFRREFLLVGHGSRVAEANAQFYMFEAALASHLGQPIRHCFVELVEPDLWAGLTAAAQEAGPGSEVVILPLFLGAALHVKHEIAGVVARAAEAFPGVTFRYALPLGFHVKLAELLDIRVRAALSTIPEALPSEETTVLVVGGGSSDPDSNSSVNRVARVLYEYGHYAAVEVAFQRVTTPTTADGVACCHQLGAKQVVVAPYLLFTGIVHQKTCQAAEDKARQLGLKLIHASYLGPTHSLLLDVAVQRMTEALDGTADRLRRQPVDGFSVAASGEPSIQEPR